MKRYSILIPVYNEEKTVAEIIAALHEHCSEAELIFINDGSKDKSLSILKELCRPEDIIIDKPNGGKGSAIRAGLEKATGKYCTIQDADLEYDPKQIPELVSVAELHKDAAVFGSRFLRRNPNIYKRFLWGNKVLTGVLNICFFSRITDSYTCYKLLPTDKFKGLGITANGFELEAEICCKCLKQRIPIHEIAVRYKPRRIEEGKKIKLSDAWKGIAMILRQRFSK